MTEQYTPRARLAVWAAISLVLCVGLYVFVLWSPGQGFGALPLAYFLVSMVTFTGIVAALSAILRAAQGRDVPSTLSLGLLLAIAGFVVYTLLQNGHEGSYPVITTIYGYPPGDLGLHTFGFQASWAVFSVVPATILTYSLMRRKSAQRIVAGAGLALMVATLGAIHLAG